MILFLSGIVIWVMTVGTRASEQHQSHRDHAIYLESYFHDQSGLRLGPSLSLTRTPSFVGEERENLGASLGGMC